MKADVLLGLQWGDEGKGKVVDYLAPKYDIIARFQGGPNAGHTLEFGDIKHVLHQIPSGIFREGVQNVIGNGVVLDPVVFQKEIEDLEKYGIEFKSRLHISVKAQLILPTHKYLDAAIEKFKGDQKIGSTLRGIGPAYQDKIGRFGIKVGDTLRSDFESKVKTIMENHKKLIEFYGGDFDGFDERVKSFFDSVSFLKQFNLTETAIYLNREMDRGKSVLAEGAQGSLLDIDFGSYPYVTSSNTITPGACIGLGIAPGRIGEVFGVFKAYCTRVGEGPFPTELFDDTGKKISQIGNEFGATTGRPRRVGWLDLPALRYAIMLNGVTQLFMMKADVLDSFEMIRVCNEYHLQGGGISTDFPDKLEDIDKAQYHVLKGWNSKLDEKCFDEGLPQYLEDYIKYIEEQTKTGIRMVSFGPKRKQTILR